MIHRKIPMQERVTVYFQVYFYRLLLQKQLLITVLQYNYSEKFCKSYMILPVTEIFLVADFSFTIKELHHRSLPVKFDKYFGIFFRTISVEQFYSFQIFMKFCQYSQSSYSISLKTLQQLPLCSPTKTIIIWL